MHSLNTLFYSITMQTFHGSDVLVGSTMSETVFQDGKNGAVALEECE